MTIRIHCQAVEVPLFNELAPQDQGRWPRDLLPWADPYIAALMMQLGKRRGETEGLLDDELTLCRFAADPWHGREWEAAPLPPRDRMNGFADPPFPPIYGGFPPRNPYAEGWFRGRLWSLPQKGFPACFRPARAFSSRCSPRSGSRALARRFSWDRGTKELHQQVQGPGPIRPLPSPLNARRRASSKSCFQAARSALRSCSS